MPTPLDPEGGIAVGVPYYRPRSARGCSGPSHAGTVPHADSLPGIAAGVERACHHTAPQCTVRAESPNDSLRPKVLQRLQSPGRRCWTVGAFRRLNRRDGEQPKGQIECGLGGALGVGVGWG